MTKPTLDVCPLCGGPADFASRRAELKVERDAARAARRIARPPRAKPVAKDPNAPLWFGRIEFPEGDPA